jgi:uncharacterized protein YbaR (Trm112 family)/2-polyprenyl-3-methyl-5-hydroxy-6-metoxy-1,4-benzoquinol methylase
LHCVRCQSKLALEILKEDSEIEEGFLYCPRCKLAFPIIDGIAILWNDFTNYLSNRPRLGGVFLLKSKTAKMKSFIKRTLGKIKQNPSDQSIIEKRWVQIYVKNQNSQFYAKIKRSLNAKSGIALEHGCSIGHMTQHLAKTNSLAFGIDKSYYAIVEAKKSKLKNLDYFVADSLEHPFGKMKFDLVVGLNIFELIEPKSLLGILAKQAQKGSILVLSDPYDFERGTKSVREPLYEDSTRNELKSYGFEISKQTTKSSFIPWNLKLYKRAELHYKVDLIIAKKF